MSPNKHGVYVGGENVELASAGKEAHAIARVVLCEDGRWRAGYAFRNSLQAASGLPSITGDSYDCRQDAIQAVERHAREHFESGLTAMGCSTAQRRQARLIMAQLDQRAKPKQLEMFAVG
jgi:hypothetical protein